MDLSAAVYVIAKSFPGLLVAIVFHEAAHAWMAYKFGDKTAYLQGRLTLNPAAHYHPIGTILIPVIGVIANFPVIGWARPVPIDSRQFSSYRKGLFWVSFAGPLVNIAIGTVFAMVYAFLTVRMNGDAVSGIAREMLEYGIFINFLLGFFNLIPLPPLDGSRMVSSFLPHTTAIQYESIQRYTPVILLGVIALSMMGIPTLGYLLAPAFKLASWIVNFFLILFS